MKLITAYFHPSVKEQVAAALSDAQFNDISFYDMPGLLEPCPSANFVFDATTQVAPDIKLSVICAARDVAKASEIIHKIADGKTGAECWVRVCDIADKPIPVKRDVDTLERKCLESLEKKLQGNRREEQRLLDSVAMDDTDNSTNYPLTAVRMR